MESDEDDIEILEPSEFKMSNRTGGFFVKKEIIEDDDEQDEDIYQEEILKVIQSESALKKFNDVMIRTDFDIPSTSNNTSKVDTTISSEDESDSDFEEVQTTLKQDEVMQIEVNPGATSNDIGDDDLFADIFEDKPNENVPEKQIFLKQPDVVTTNFETLEQAKNDKVFQIEIQPDEKPSNAKDDLFADVFQDEPEVNDFEAQEEKISVTEYSAEKMKQTDQLFLKIASKYMEPSTSQSNSANKGEHFKSF